MSVDMKQFQEQLDEKQSAIHSEGGGGVINSGNVEKNERKWVR